MGQLKALMKVKIPYVSIVNNCLTLHEKNKWKFVEAKTCTIPTTAAEKNNGSKSSNLSRFLNTLLKIH